MAKKAGKGMGYGSKSVGGKADGARSSKKGQTAGTLAVNASAGIRQSRSGTDGGKGSGRTARIARMEKHDPRC